MTETAGPGADEYEVLIVRYGTRRTVRSDVYLNHRMYGEADGPIDMDYFFWVVRNDRRTVLVDTGFSRAGGDRRRRTFVVDPARAYHALGVDAASGPTVVVTHAHYDHVGNLSLFPASPIVIAEAELDFWTGPFARRGQFHHSVEDDELRTLAEADKDGRVRTFSGSTQVAPGVDVIQVGGHTPGQSVVRVQTADGPVLLASDAIHYYEEFERDMPFAFVANLVDMYAGFDRIREMVTDGDVRHLVSGHDPDTLARFRPLPDAPADLVGHVGLVGRASGAAPVPERVGA